MSLAVAKTMQTSLYRLALQLVLVYEMVTILAVAENRYVGCHWSPNLKMMQLLLIDTLVVAENGYMGRQWSHLLYMV